MIFLQRKMAIYVRCILQKAMGSLLQLALVLIIFGSIGQVALAQDDRQFSEWGRSDRLSNPGSTLGEPFASPIYLGGHVAFGGAFNYDQGNTGYGLELIMRPGAAVKYLSFLFRQNIGLVLQADYMNVDSDRRILSGDFILRKYFADMRYPEGKVSPFLGLGFGASEITLQPPDGTGIDKYWCGVVEGGMEWDISHKYVAYVKGQYRYYNYHGMNYSNWSCMVGAGIPLPW